MDLYNYIFYKRYLSSIQSNNLINVGLEQSLFDLSWLDSYMVTYIDTNEKH